MSDARILCDPADRTVLVEMVTAIAAGYLANPVASQAIQRDCERSGRFFSAEIAVVAVDQMAAISDEIARRFDFQVRV